MPFIAVLVNPENVETNPILARAYEFSGAQTSWDFLRLLGFAVFALLIISIAFRLFAHWAQVRYSQNRVHDISCRVMQRFLSQPSHWFLNRHSSRASTPILNGVNHVVSGALFPALRMLTRALVALSLIMLLLFLEPLLALIMAAVVAAAYVVVYALVRSRLSRVGRLRLEANRARFRAMNETFGGFKDVKIAGLESTMMQRYRGPTRTMVRQVIRAQLIEMVPSYVMQCLIFGGMVLVSLYLIIAHGDTAGALPVAATFAFAGYRLMPSLQQVYGNISQVRAASASLESLIEDLRKLPPEEALFRDEGRAARLPLEREIRLENVTYFYPSTSEPALKDLSLTVPVNQTIGLVGSTGGGKTTTIDVILGLLTPQEVGC